MIRRCLTFSLAIVLLAAGCGGEDEARPEGSSAVVDAGAEPPYIGALDVNPKDGSLLMATNAGTFRVARGSDAIARIDVKVSARNRTGPADKGLAFTFTGPDTLVGSGHPGPGEAVAPLLGLIRSSDGGRTWRNVSRLGESDLHAVVQRGGAVVASDGGEAKVIFSEDRGRTFRSRAAPLRLIDMDARPGDPERLVGSTESGVYTSDDGGQTWRQRDSIPGARFAWAEPGSLFRVDGDGAVKRSADDGATWEDVGKVDGEPHALAAAGARVLYAADIDGVIRESGDGGRSWKERARP